MLPASAGLSLNTWSFGAVVADGAFGLTDFAVSLIEIKHLC